jgi:predicted permease
VGDPIFRAGIIEIFSSYVAFAHLLVLVSHAFPFSGHRLQTSFPRKYALVCALLSTTGNMNYLPKSYTDNSLLL